MEGRGRREEGKERRGRGGEVRGGGGRKEEMGMESCGDDMYRRFHIFILYKPTPPIP